MLTWNREKRLEERKRRYGGIQIQGLGMKKRRSAERRDAQCDGEGPRGDQVKYM